MVYSERELLDEPVRKIATRNRYYDENECYVRTKKEGSENGQLRPGCSMVAKGEVYEEHLFDKKKKIFKDKGFLDDVKKDFTEIINELSDPNEKLKVFDRNGPYIPTRKVGKNNPKEKDIREENKLRDTYNARVNDALNIGIDREKLIEFKKEEVYKPAREMPKEETAGRDMFAAIIDRAQRTLAKVVKRLFFKPEEYKTNIQNNYWKEFIESCVLDACRKALTNEMIEEAVKTVAEYNKRNQESPEIIRLKDETKSVENKIDKLLTEIEEGLSSARVKSHLAQREEELDYLQHCLKKEMAKQRIIDPGMMRDFLRKLRRGKYDTLQYQKMLIRIFVDKTYLYEDHFTIFLNNNKKRANTSKAEVETIEEYFTGVGSNTSARSVPIKQRRFREPSLFYLDIIGSRGENPKGRDR